MNLSDNGWYYLNEKLSSIGSGCPPSRGRSDFMAAHFKFEPALDEVLS